MGSFSFLNNQQINRINFTRFFVCLFFFEFCFYFFFSLSLFLSFFLSFFLLRVEIFLHCARATVK